MQVRFVLSRKADEANGQEVILRLEEKHAGTSHYKEYKSLRYYDAALIYQRFRLLKDR